MSGLIDSLMGTSAVISVEWLKGSKLTSALQRISMFPQSSSTCKPSKARMARKDGGGRAWMASSD